MTFKDRKIRLNIFNDRLFNDIDKVNLNQININKMLNIRLYLPILITFFFLFCENVSSQTLSFHPGPGSYVTVTGTSTLHDWEMKSDDIVSEVQFRTNEEGEPENLESLIFKLNKTTLKSDKSGLEKRAYDALNARQFPDITFEMHGNTSVQRNGDSYVVRSSGDLSVAGMTRQIRINATCINGEEAKLVCTGSQQLKMSDFNIDPPVMMLGALRTGDEVTISYNIVLTH